MRVLAPVLVALAVASAPPAAAAGKTAEEVAAMALYNQGRARFDAGDFAGAEALFAKSLSVFATPYARLYRAASLARLSRCADARSEADRFSPEDVAPRARDKARAMVAKIRKACPPGAAAETEEKAETATGTGTGTGTATGTGTGTATGTGTGAAEEAGTGTGTAPPPAAIEAEREAAEAAAARKAEADAEKVRARMPAAGRPVVVATDGSGDFTRLEDALAKTKPGTPIHLNAGLHRLSKPLDLKGPVRLVGDGRGSTVIVGDGEGFVVRFSGKGPFEVHDLAIEHEGGRWARVVVVDDGDVDLRGLKVSGGVRDPVGKQGGEGLLLTGDAAGTVAGCEFSGNALHGIKLAGKAHPVLEGNTARANGKGGIVWFEASGGVARANNCSGNGQYGMAVVDHAAPRLIGNACSDNRRGGLYLESGRTDGLAENRCDLYTTR